MGEIVPARWGNRARIDRACPGDRPKNAGNPRLVGLARASLRGYTLTTSPHALVGIQLLDGIGAEIFGGVGTLVIADLTRGTGRFNLMQGALATATGIGAAASNLMTGFVVQARGYDAGFLVLAAIAATALLFFGAAMPETLADPREAPEPSRRRAALALDRAS